MQRYCTELTERLLKSLDKEYNVVDMGAVVDVITALEKTTITKEVLEITRLGKYINELRRKTSNDALAKRAKDLVRRWRDMVLPSSHSTPQPTPADTAPQALNGTKPQSPALRGLKPHSPAAIRALKPHSPALKAQFKPHSPLLRDSTPFKQVLSPALSLHSDQSHSPNPPSMRHNFQQPSLGQTAPTGHTGPTTTTTNTTNHRPNANATPILGPIGGHNHTIDPVPRTHSSNKRLRKDEAAKLLPTTPPLHGGISGTSLLTSKSQQYADSSISSRLEPPSKRPRLNGEALTNFSQTTTNNNIVAARLSTTPTTTMTTTTTTTTTTVTAATSNQVTSLNQQVPSPRDAEKPNDRLSSNDHFGTSSSELTTSESITGSSNASTRNAEAIGAPQLPIGPKKRGRKKGSKSIKSQALPEDRVKEKLASISRNPKLKTTQELLADLQARGASMSAKFSTGTTTTTTTTNIGPSSRDNSDVTLSNDDDSHRGNNNDDRSLSSRCNKREKTNDYGDNVRRKNRDNEGSHADDKRWDGGTKNHPDDEDDDDDGDSEQHDETSTNIVGLTKELSVEEILAKLPPIDLDSINWSDSDDNTDERDVIEDTTRIREITESDVDKLHNECVEGLNGNFQAKIDLSLERVDGASIVDDGDVRDVVDDDDDGGDVDGTLRTNDDTRITGITDKCVYGRRLEKKNDNRDFREWHEMLARPSYESQILHILPYVIID